MSLATGYLDNYYSRLGISKNSTPEEIRDAYHNAARRLHPDSNKDPAATELFIQVQEAYETLYNAEKRIEYDKSLPDDLDPPQDVMVNAIYSRRAMQTMNNPQLIYVLLDLMATPEAKDIEKEKGAGYNVALILDTSTSMSGPRLEAVKTTAAKLVKVMRSQDTLSIISFNDRAEVVVPATRGINYRNINPRISQLQARGGTEIYKGLEAGMAEVNRFLNPSFINHMILITDGRTYGDEEKCLKLAVRAAEKGITISGLGIGSEWNDEFLDELTSRTGGNSAYASQPKNIQDILTSKFGNINRTFANNITINFTSDPDVELRYAFKLLPEVGTIPTESPLSIGNIPMDGNLSILMEFMMPRVPEKSTKTVLLEGKLKFNIPTRVIPNASTKISLIRSVEKNPEHEPPPQVLIKAMSKLSLYRLQHQARQELEAGDIEKATTRLTNLATQLLESGNTELANTINLELKNLENGESFSAEAQKRIKYGTRSLLMSDLEESP